MKAHFKVHLIDGTYELFRAHFAILRREGPQAAATGATRGLLSSLLALLRQDDVTHVACAFDTVIESFRNRLFAGYKTGEGVDEALLAQFPQAEQAAHALGLVVWPMKEFEADDALATGAARWADDEAVEQVLLCSPDKDLAQCVRGRKVVCLDRRREQVLDEDGVLERFGVPPAAIPDYLGLVGDTADGIPGIPGWGARSTATVLAHYGRLEDIPEDAAAWKVTVRGAARLAQALAERRKDAVLYRELARLRTDVPLTETLADLEWKGARRDALESLCDRLDSRKLLDRVTRWR